MPVITDFYKFLFDERINKSPYKLKFLQEKKCKELCVKKYQTMDKNDLRKLTFLKEAINLNYKQNWIIDKLPIMWCYITIDNYEYCTRGFPIGCYVTKTGQKSNPCMVSFYLSKNFSKIINCTA